ncbi:hypothetical protein ACFE04_001997 [Oxalis oulophora]
MASHTLLATLQVLLITLFLFHEVASLTRRPPIRYVGGPRKFLYRHILTMYLREHNRARAEVGVRPLKWSEGLANASASLIKDGCTFSNPTINGINYYIFQEKNKLQTKSAVGFWVSEKKFYNHANNSCMIGHHCRSYTQVVWRKSTEVGCATATCGKARLTACFYNPPGNVEGESPY